METKNKKSIIGRILYSKLSILVAPIIGGALLFSGLTKMINQQTSNQENNYRNAIEQNTISVTNNNHIYSAYLQENVQDFRASAVYPQRRLTLEDRGAKGVYGRLTGVDNNKDGVIDEVNISQVPEGNSLNNLTLTEIQKIYDSFKNSVDLDGKAIPINRNYVIENAEILEFKGDLEYLVLRDKKNTNNFVRLRYEEVESFEPPRRALAEKYQKPFALIRTGESTNAEIYPLDGISPRRYIR